MKYELNKNKLKLAVVTVAMLSLSPIAKSQYQCVSCPDGSWSPGGTRTSCVSTETSYNWRLIANSNNASGSITASKMYIVYLRGGNGGRRYGSGGSGGVLQYRFKAYHSGTYTLGVGGNGVGNDSYGGGSSWLRLYSYFDGKDNYFVAGGGGGGGRGASGNVDGDYGIGIQSNFYGGMGGSGSSGGAGRSSHSKNYISPNLTCSTQVCLWEFRG